MSTDRALLWQYYCFQRKKRGRHQHTLLAHDFHVCVHPSCAGCSRHTCKREEHCPVNVVCNAASTPGSHRACCYEWDSLPVQFETDCCSCITSEGHSTPLLADSDPGTMQVQLLQAHGLTVCCCPPGGAEPVWWRAAARGHHAVSRAACRHLSH